jgi:Starch binding domain
MGDNSGYGDWQFCVQAEVSPGETLAVVGDCAELGQWRLQKAFDLQCGNEGSEIPSPLLRAMWPLTILACRNIWRGNVRLPRGKTITYRYLVCVLVPSDGEQLMEMVRVVKRWETHPQSRRITQQGIALRRNLVTILTSSFWVDLERSHSRDEPEEFGLVSGLQQVERGWLTSETVVQLKIFGEEPIKMWKRRLLNKQVITYTLTKCANRIILLWYKNNFTQF